MNWQKLPNLPDREGFAGSFAGTSHGALLVAGGANFPDKRPWEGGTKVWTDSVFGLERPGGTWRTLGKLPGPRGYGVSASYQDSLLCVGGSDSTRHHPDAFALEWRAGRLVTRALPPLPIPLANACGARVDDQLFVVGGQEAPGSTSASNRAFCLTLSRIASGWSELPPLPGPGRILATAAAHEGSLWVFGGAELFAKDDGTVLRRYLRDAYQYAPQTGWRRLADLPAPAVAAPTPAPTSAEGIYLLGGDDGQRTGLPQQAHPGFSKALLRYEPTADQWRRVGELRVARVTVPVVHWEDRWVIAGGEARPGVRSPEVWAVRP